MDQLEKPPHVVSMDVVNVGLRHCRRKQQISVPFQWEHRPGKPKKNWPSSIVVKGTVSDGIFSASVTSRPAASVPFRWEQKPGTPLSLFVPAWLTRKPTVAAHDPLVILHGYNDSLSVNKPEQEEDHFGLQHNGVQADSCTSKTCDTGSNDGTSVVEDDASGLELLYPLALAPPAPGGFLSKIFAPEGAGSRDESDVGGIDDRAVTGSRSGGGLVVRRTMTLAELMLLSRKLSDAAKSPLLPRKEHKHSCSRDFMLPLEFMRKLLACF